MAKLAINGGTPVRSEPFAVWPQYTEEEAQAAADVPCRVLRSKDEQPPDESS